MLASDTQAIADFLKQIIRDHYNLNDQTISDRFADTRDTLCYATTDNQGAVSAMLEQEAELAIVVGGRNSSNTSHLVELCEEVLPTWFIRSEADLISPENILHYNWRTKLESYQSGYLPTTNPLRILITSGASCPDAMVEAVIRKIISWYPNAGEFDALIEEMK